MKNILFMVLLWMVSCNRSSENTIGNVIHVDIQNLCSLDFNEVYDSVRYVPLELTDESLLGSIDKLYKSDSCYILFDSKQMNIMVYDLDGSFRCAVGHKGNGMDEYICWNDVYYSKEDRYIYAHERFQNRIYVYDTYGNLIFKTKQSKYQFNSFIKTSKGFFVYSCFKKPYNKDGYNLMLLDEELQEQKNACFPQEEFVNASICPAFFTSDHDEYFYYPSSNIVYKLGEEVVPYCQFDFGVQTMPYDEIVRLNSVEAYEQLLSGHGYLGDIKHCLSNGHWISFQFSEADFNKPVENYYSMYNLKDKKLYVETSPFIDFGLYPIHRNLKFLDDEVGIYLLPPYLLQKESLEMLSQQMGVQLTEDSNPVLVVCYLKNKL